MVKAKAYCIAFGCLNKNNNPDLTFFSLPKDIERRRKWLTLLDREDLLHKKDMKRKTNLVCSVHFESSSMKMIKHLKDYAMPTLFLPNQPQGSPFCSSTQSKSTQTEDHINRFTVGTQTVKLEPLEALEEEESLSLPLDTRRKRKYEIKSEPESE